MADLLWQKCGLCGCVVADPIIHDLWHVSHGEQVPDGEQRTEAPDPVGVGDVGVAGDNL